MDSGRLRKLIRLEINLKKVSQKYSQVKEWVEYLKDDECETLSLRLSTISGLNGTLDLSKETARAFLQREEDILMREQTKAEKLFEEA